VFLTCRLLLYQILVDSLQYTPVLLVPRFCFVCEHRPYVKLGACEGVCTCKFPSSATTPYQTGFEEFSFLPKTARRNRGKGVSVEPALPQATSRVRSNENDANLAALNTIQNLGSAIREGITMPKRNLPVFDGDPLQYFGFLKRFEEIVLKQISEPPLQLEYLIDMCVGKAADAVRSCIPRLLHCKRLSTDWQVTLAVSTSWFKHI